tara:strand:- start:260 stop:436 length:177 start_codon:yes stop_codon:yes gene_type:complete
MTGTGTTEGTSSNRRIGKRGVHLWAMICHWKEEGMGERVEIRSSREELSLILVRIIGT